MPLLKHCHCQGGETIPAMPLSFHRPWPSIVIDNPVIATISDSRLIDSGAVSLTSEAGATLWSLTVAGTAGLAGSQEDNVGALGGAGALTVNVVATPVESSIKDGSSVTTVGGGDVRLSATNTSLIMADAGGLSGTIASGNEGMLLQGPSVWPCPSMSLITVSLPLLTMLLSLASGELEMTATSDADLWALTIGGSVAVAFSQEEAAFGVALGGAVTVNAVTGTIRSYIKGSTVTTGTDSGITMSATDNALVMGNAVGLGFAGVLANSTSVGVSGGASLAVNVIDSTTKAYMEASDVTSGGDVDMDAVSDAVIWALAVGGAGAVVKSEYESGYAVSLAGQWP